MKTNLTNEQKLLLKELYDLLVKTFGLNNSINYAEIMSVCDSDWRKAWYSVITLKNKIFIVPSLVDLGWLKKANGYNCYSLLSVDDIDMITTLI